MVKVRGLSPYSGLSPLLLMKKCCFMHKMCQIPHPDRHLRPLLDLATLINELIVMNKLNFNEINHIKHFISYNVVQIGHIYKEE